MILRSIFVIVVFSALALYGFYSALEARLRWFDAAPMRAAASAYDVEIIRDARGVPHIYGRTDGDVAFGLAYAHAEDEFQAIQRAILAARGRLASVDGFDAVDSDYLVRSLGIHDDVAAYYETALAPETRALLEAYALGLNYFAATHETELLPGVAPVEGQDIAALVTLRTLSFYGLDTELLALIRGETPAAAARASTPEGLGIAVAPARAGDGSTRLLADAQGPNEGRDAWYEARVQSASRWDMTGGTLPGVPLLLFGSGPESGWAIAMNRPDLLDLYALQRNPADAGTYWIDGAWRAFSSEETNISVKLWGPLQTAVSRTLLRSGLGPVIESPHGSYAIRYAGQGDIRGVEAFYRLNRARDADAFTAALDMQAIPGLDVTYGGRTGTILGIPNTLVPDRPAGIDFSLPVAGNSSALVWSGYRPFAAPLPNGTGGLVISEGPESMAGAADNRLLRARHLTDDAAVIGKDELRAIKFDKCYDPQAPLVRGIQALGAVNYAGDPLLEEAGQILHRYDLCTDENNRGAALSLVTALALARVPGNGTSPNGAAILRDAAELFLSAFGRLDPRWGDVTRLRADGLDLPLGGGPGVLRDITLTPWPAEDGTLTVTGGDSLALLTTWERDGTWSVESVSSRQPRLFARETMTTVPLSREAVLREASRVERPRPRETRPKP